MKDDANADGSVAMKWKQSCRAHRKRNAGEKEAYIEHMYTHAAQYHPAEAKAQRTIF